MQKTPYRKDRERFACARSAPPGINSTARYTKGGSLKEMITGGIFIVECGPCEVKNKIGLVHTRT
jgi:hypothetical protein